MSWLRQLIYHLAAVAVVSAQAQSMPLPSPVKFSAAAANIFPPLPQAESPVGFFRQLLAMSPDERANSLTNRPLEVRTRILAKVREYTLLGADEREFRLRATELRWYLTLLLRLPVAERAERIALVPEDLRGLVKSRLAQWDILPTPLQQEFMTNDQALHYFAHVETMNRTAATAGQQKIAEQFNRFFELTPAEKQETLGTLTGAERAQMETTLKSFGQLPPQQRFQCIRNYAKFAGMAPAERANFLKNAENWSKLTPQERQAWCDLVAQVPIWPPLPPDLVPSNILPPIPSRNHRLNVATNF